MGADAMTDSRLTHDGHAQPVQAPSILTAQIDAGICRG